jgi:hypothetical protein
MEKALEEDAASNGRVLKRLPLNVMLPACAGLLLIR